MNLFKRDLVGIYFGTQGVCIVESKSSLIVNYSYELFPKDLTGPSGITVTSTNIFDVFLGNEVEITAFLQKIIRESKVSAKEVVVALPSKDLLVRFFEIPPIPRSELDAGISFEIKKYIPFKTDELAFDYQTRGNPQGIEVLFTGIKNEQLNKYSSIISQLGLKIVAMEPSQFCLIRTLRLKGVLAPKDTALVIEIDQAEGVFSIADIGFPCFTRDIRLDASIEENNKDSDALIFRLINEARVSIDYFRRQFLKRGVNKIIVLAKNPPLQLVDDFNKELGVPVVLKAPDELIGVKEQYSLDLAKAFGASIRLSKPLSLTINLSKRVKTSVSEDKAGDEQAPTHTPALYMQRLDPSALLDLLDIPRKVLVRGIIISLFVIIGIFIFSNSKVLPYLKQLQAIVHFDEGAPAELQNLKKVELEKIRNEESRHLSVYQRDFVRDLLVSEKLFILSELMPEGAWLTDVSFSRNNSTILLKGMVYLEDEQEASRSLYEFVDNMKKSPVFSHNVSRVELISVRSSHTTSPKDGKQYKVVNFEIGVYISSRK